MFSNDYVINIEINTWKITGKFPPKETKYQILNMGQRNNGKL